MRRPIAARGASVLTRTAIVLACACAHDAPRRPLAWLVIEAAFPDPDSAAPLDSAVVEPASAVVRSLRSGARLMLGIDMPAGPGQVLVHVPGACSLPIAASELAPASTLTRTMVRRIELQAPPHPRDLGYGAPFVIDAVPGCPDPPGSVVWRQVSGPTLRDVRSDSNGLRFEARTAEAADVGLNPPAHGIVPVSRHASAVIAIEAGWRPAKGGTSSIQWQRIELSSASRARGLPNVGVNEGVLLAGPGWSTVAAPPEATAPLQPAGAFTRLIPDVAGPWVLRDGEGRAISLRAGRYDETPLDCGRSSCHGVIVDAAQTSPMTAALRSLIGPETRTPSDVACALACHATGEPGVHDGGFTDVMRGFDVGGGWSALPRAARRLGGVTCLACHGPSAIPESSARWAVLRADVCSTCHDAPPTYGHVAAWRSSRMALSDADPRSRAEAACARCHTTSGFLASVGDGPDRRAPPSDTEPIGIACAACHAPHDTHRPQGDAHAEHLIRDVPLPESLAGASVAEPSRICLRCHAPDAPFARGSREAGRSPSGSAAAIWAGRGGVDPETGGPIEAPSVHGAVEKGCVGCHAKGPGGLERGAGHGFKADLATCTGCHPSGAPDAAPIERQLHDRATSVLTELVALSPSVSTREPHHADAPPLRNDRIGRATYDALLVLEDPASGAHNAPFARALLDAAERASRGLTGDAP